MTTIDIRLFHAINDWAGRFPVLDTLGAFVAEYFPVILAVFLLVQWFWRKEFSYRSVLLLSILAFVISEAAAKLVGKMYTHVQPFAALPNVHQLIEKKVDNSFPSDHTVLIFSFMTVLFLHTKNKKRYMYLFVAVLAGLSRIFVGVHYPSDVAVGAMLAIGISCFCYYLLKDSKGLSNLVVAISSMEARIFGRGKRGMNQKDE